jgi:cation diffusion facilitator family transporter
MNRGIRLAQLGLLANGVLALVKLVAGILGNSYALIADAVESIADLFSSLIVWGGLRVASRDADDRYPFGYGKAEALAAMVVGLMLLAAAIGIAVQAVLEILNPHRTPAPFTLVVLVVVVAVKSLLYRVVNRTARASGSPAVAADAWHHLADAMSSTAAFIGISIAVLGGPAWKTADAWAALFASGLILVNGLGIMRPSVGELMDRSPSDEMLRAVDAAAHGVDGVLATEKLKARKSGTRFLLEVHVQAEPSMSLHEAHVLSGKVKRAIRSAVPSVQDVLVHMEPFEGA